MRLRKSLIWTKLLFCNLLVLKLTNLIKKQKQESFIIVARAKLLLIVLFRTIILVIIKDISFVKMFSKMKKYMLKINY
jgi:hypothetical protein